MLNGIKDVAQYVNDERKSGELIEKLRWPDGIKCAHCEHDVVYSLKGPNPDRKQWKCAKCRKKFSVTTNSIFEASHIKLGHWVYAIFKMCSSKKGISACQLQRELGISYKASWFMCHRVRWAMTQEPVAGMLGKDSGIVEIDEVFIGGKKSNNLHRNKGPKAGKKTAVMTLIDREGPAVGVVVPNVKKKTLQKIAKPIVDRSATIITDAHVSYEGLSEHFGAHFAVDHSKTFVRAVILHTNFAESYHSLLKRGVIGTFHHVSDRHLGRYVDEFSHRWNTRKDKDGDRAEQTITLAQGKRLTYTDLIEN